MSPRSLLFSSDQETLRQLTHTLQEFGLSVEACSEIFAALKTLTGKTLHVIAVDWDEGLEASFLLKTARESKANHEIFAIVVGKSDARAALEHAGADLVLSKPLQADRVRHALFTSEAFMRRARNWPSQKAASASSSGRSPVGSSVSSSVQPEAQPSALAAWPTAQTKPVPAMQPAPSIHASSTHVPSTHAPSIQGMPERRPVVGWPASTETAHAEKPVEREAPIHLSFATFENGLAGESVFSSTFSLKGKNWKFPLAGRSLLARCAAIGIVFFAVGYVFSQPLSTVSSVFATAGRGIWKNIQGSSHPGSSQQGTSQQASNQQPAEAGEQSAEIAAAEIPSDVPARNEKPSRIRIVPAHNSFFNTVPAATSAPEPIARAAALHERSREQERSPEAQLTEAHTEPSRSALPDSLGAPFPGLAAAREVAARVTPALMDALRPVNIPGALSEKLLLEKIVPNYPERALQAGLRGPVVLQAWIGKDGKIQELKLIHGPLLLGQAAFDAVRSWRYKPYLLNGEAVEAQTQVTVDFKLP